MAFLLILTDYWRFTPDDAYIYFYGARQLANGELPNTATEDCPTNAFSSFIWLLLITPTFILGVPPEIWAKILGILFLFGTFIIFILLFRLLYPEGGKSLSILLAGTLLVFPPMIACSLNGMESSFATFTLILTLYLVIKDYKSGGFSVFTGLSLSLHLLSRPDSFIDIIIVAAFVVYSIFQGKVRKISAVRLFLGFLPGILGLVILKVIYGCFLPTSASAKIPGFFSFFEPGQLYLIGLRITNDFNKDVVLYLLYFVLIIYMILRRKDAEILLLAGCSFSHLLVFALIPDFIGEHRLYIHSIIIAFLLFFVFFFERFNKKAIRIFFITLMAVAMFGSFNYWKILLGIEFVYPDWPGIRMGKLINEHKLDDSWLLAGDMGVVPYYGEIRTIDANNRPICNSWLCEHPLDIDYVKNRELDFIIIMKPNPKGEGVTRFKLVQLIENSDWFRDNYRKVAVAVWRPDIEGYRQRGFDFGTGRYFHLYVSDRIKTIPEGKIYIFE